MPRPGQPLLHVSAPSSATVVPQDYMSLLGGNLVALWHQGSGVVQSGGNVTSWADVVASKQVTPAGGGTAAALGADGSNFGGKNVVKFTASGQMLSTDDLTTFVAAGGRPYLFVFARFRDTVNESSYPYTWALNDTDEMCQFLFPSPTRSAAQFRQPSAIHPLFSPGFDTSPHFDEAWLDGSFAHVTRDGLDVTMASTGVITPAINRVRLTNQTANISIMMLGLCTAAPSPANRTALRTLAMRDAGMA